jgi:hypothetical protein
MHPEIWLTFRKKKERKRKEKKRKKEPFHILARRVQPQAFSHEHATAQQLLIEMYHKQRSSLGDHLIVTKR